MELANTTALAARVDAWDGDEPGRRDGVATAKATYRYTPAGEVSLDVARPFPLFDNDEGTPFGLLPRDDLPRGPEGFEVIFLGSAHAPRGRTVTEMTVSLRVGEVERALAVIGDRAVVDGTITAPEPFSRMDLGWSNAFGGAVEALIDRDAPVVITDPRNPAGKGLDARAQAVALCEQLRAPAGYPVIPDGPRALPNVEHPARRITAATDAPDPAGWATLPMSSAAMSLRAVDLARARPGAVAFTPRIFHRAADEWIIGRPAEGAEVALRGLDPEGEVRFALPALRVACDFLIAGHATTLELLPETLALVGPWRRFTVTYRARFHYWETEGDMASARLWTRDGRGR